MKSSVPLERLRAVLDEDGHSQAVLSHPETLAYLGYFEAPVEDWPVSNPFVFVPALLINVASGLIFLFAPSLPGLLVARVICGISIGLTTATATAYLGELHAGVFRSEAVSPRRAQVVATAANLGGIGFGPVVAGLLAQYAPPPLRLPYILFGVVLIVLAVLVAASPETAERPVPVPRWRPQRLAVPAHARRVFFVAQVGD